MTVYSRFTVAKSRPTVRISRRMRLSLPPAPGVPRQPVGVDGVEAIAALVRRVTDRVWAVPEGRIEDRDVVVDQRLLVAFEQLADLSYDFGDVHGGVDHALAPCL